MEGGEVQSRQVLEEMGEAITHTHTHTHTQMLRLALQIRGNKDPQVSRIHLQVSVAETQKHLESQESCLSLHPSFPPWSHCPETHLLLWRPFTRPQMAHPPPDSPNPEQMEKAFHLIDNPLFSMLYPHLFDLLT